MENYYWGERNVDIVERRMKDLILRLLNDEKKNDSIKTGGCPQKEPVLDDFEKIRACALCGGAVTVERGITGTTVYIPVDTNWLDRMMAQHSSDEFILDRLRRAERIIVDLRKRLDEKHDN